MHGDGETASQTALLVAQLVAGFTCANGSGPTADGRAAESTEAAADVKSHRAPDVDILPSCSRAVLVSPQISYRLLAISHQLGVLVI